MRLLLRVIFETMDGIHLVGNETLIYNTSENYNAERRSLRSFTAMVEWVGNLITPVECILPIAGMSGAQEEGFASHMSFPCQWKYGQLKMWKNC